MPTEALPGAAGGRPATRAGRSHHEDKRAAVSGRRPALRAVSQDTRISICEADRRVESSPEVGELARDRAAGFPVRQSARLERIGQPGPAHVRQQRIRGHLRFRFGAHQRHLAVLPGEVGAEDDAGVVVFEALGGVDAADLLVAAGVAGP